jgi:CHRD domain
MNKYVAGFGLGVLALTALVMHTSTAFAETVNLKASLNASASVPPTNSSGTGNLQATYDTATKELTYTVTYSDLTGNATAAHFHGPADPDKTAGVVVPVQGSVAPPIKGTATLTDAQAADLLAGTSTPRRTGRARFAAKSRSDVHQVVATERLARCCGSDSGKNRQPQGSFIREPG